MDFEELGKEEKKLLLKAYNYEVNEEGIICDSLLKEPIISEDTRRPITLDAVGLLPGSLKLIDTTPLTISKFLRSEALKENGD